ncbi:MAG TPA: hypothetical protein VEU96_02750, partial [Bryobacteraceae bacterium]|nr:hypothetical protein [Bryobacteraceae bacterium]
LIFIRSDDNQMDTPGRQVLRRFSADLVVFVDFAHYANGPHTVGSIWIISRRRAGIERSRGKVRLRSLQNGLAPDPVGSPLDRAF